jgi:lipopolysaccharide transport system ATP-binding protein
VSNLAIRAERLSKRYRIGDQVRYKTVRDTLTDLLRTPIRTRLSWHQSSKNYIWALNQISFDIQRGEVIGIVGPNGSGKSTLLKILSRITEPTEGLAEVHGRVGSLLEVGTGFHPELTGRENIYLNGAILGMTRREIARKFDEIVAFAEVEKFIDSPVKHYSTGMYMRLAFAVAAHLETEILLVDEVLAVGDIEFQKKSLGKMEDLAKQERTVVFVSHNMGAIAQLCQRAVLLRGGRIELMDRTESVIHRYLSENASGIPDVTLDPSRNPNASVVLTRIWIADRAGKPIPVVDVTEPFAIGIRVLVRRRVSDADLGVRFYNALGQPLFTCNLSDSKYACADLTTGEHSFLIEMPSMFLAPDDYSLTVGAHRPNREVLDYHEHLLSFRVEESGSAMWQYQGTRYGNILVKFPWRSIGA